jgi:hypothetical protein
MTCSKYRNQANFNHKLAHESREAFPDWAVTICFYTALHLVENFACERAVDIGGYSQRSPHDARRLYVRDLARDLNNRNLRIVYEELERESKRSRYLKDLDMNARDYYQQSQNKSKVTKAFQNLQIITGLLSN